MAIRSYHTGPRSDSINKICRRCGLNSIVFMSQGTQANDHNRQAKDDPTPAGMYVCMYVCMMAWKMMILVWSAYLGGFCVSTFVLSNYIRRSIEDMDSPVELVMTQSCIYMSYISSYPSLFCLSYIPTYSERFHPSWCKWSTLARRRSHIIIVRKTSRERSTYIIIITILQQQQQQQQH